MFDTVLKFLNDLVEEGDLKILTVVLTVTLGAAVFLGWNTLKYTTTIIKEIDISETISNLTDEYLPIFENELQVLTEKADELLNQFRK